MNDPKEETKIKNSLNCERCGKSGAINLGDHCVCEDCYGVYGSCCMEFGSDDLWKQKEEEKEK